MTGMGRISAEGELFSERRIYGMSTRLNGLSLFSGIGGIDLAFTWAGGHILAFCEIDNYCQQVLRKQWPDVPIFSDVHALNKEAMQNAEISTSVDVIYGGFPCQPFSLAGNKKGKDDPCVECTVRNIQLCYSESFGKPLYFEHFGNIKSVFPL